MSHRRAKAIRFLIKVNGGNPKNNRHNYQLLKRFAEKGLVAVARQIRNNVKTTTN